ncbi:MAG: ROK family transcriptional regulator [Phyllobacteriaceae bacterium]|jgi:predicted NBD/HSP70 family sugar kinase|nr:ROK family transcriptional regulator [Phyllobacteriaceae bacterium]
MPMTDPRNISRRISLCTVMQAITNCGPISRASIAKQTGLSKQTVSEIAQQLENDGWIREIGRTSGHIGRSAVTYEIVPEAAYIASVDLGGTKVRVALADLGCCVIAEAVEPTNVAGGRQVVQQIARICRSLAEKQNVASDKLAFATVGVPGVPNADTGRIQMAPNIAGLDAIDFTGLLAADLGISVQVENDVNLAVLGEHWAGCGQDIDDLVFVSFGTGIGAGLVINGKLVRGAIGAAGELGFLPFGADPFDPQILKAGALETRAGSIGMQVRYRELSNRNADVPEIFDRAEQGDQHATQTLDETAQLLARVMATIAAVANPSLIVLGGSIGQRPELLERLKPAVEACFPFPVPLKVSELGSKAAIVGGAAIGLNKLHHMLFADGLSGVDLTLPRPEVVTLKVGAR